MNDMVDRKLTLDLVSQEGPAIQAWLDAIIRAGSGQGWVKNSCREKGIIVDIQRYPDYSYVGIDFALKMDKFEMFKLGVLGSIPGNCGLGVITGHSLNVEYSLSTGNKKEAMELATTFMKSVIRVSQRYYGGAHYLVTTNDHTQDLKDIVLSLGGKKLHDFVNRNSSNNIEVFMVSLQDIQEKDNAKSTT